MREEDYYAAGVVLPVPAIYHTNCPTYPTNQVMNEDVPLVTSEEFSPEFRDFVRLCLQKDPLKRPSAEQLLVHPFIKMVRGSGSLIAGLLQTHITITITHPLALSDPLLFPCSMNVIQSA